MDSAEKRVIRWKRHLIASSVVLSNENIDKLVARGLMWPDTLEQIKGVLSNFGRVWKYLELLTSASIERSAFESFCDFLDDQHPWLGEELRVELTAERNQLEVDENTRREAAQLVRRFFGTDGKFPAGDKKRLEEVIAVRVQVAKEVWRRTMQSTRKSLHLQTMTGREREERLGALRRNVDEFVESQKKKVSGYLSEEEAGIHPDVATSAVQKREKMFTMDGKVVTGNRIDQLEASIERLELVTSRCVLDFEGLRQEKIQALEHLSVSDEDSPLDREVKAAIVRLADSRDRSETRAKSEEEKLRRVEAELDEAKQRYEDQLRERDRNIRFLASSLEKTNDKVSISESELRDVRRQLGAANADLAKFKVKSKYLEKTRHFGYGYFCDGHPADYKKPIPVKERFPRIAGRPVMPRQGESPVPTYDRKVVTHRPGNESGQSALSDSFKL